MMSPDAAPDADERLRAHPAFQTYRRALDAYLAGEIRDTQALKSTGLELCRVAWAEHVPAERVILALRAGRSSRETLVISPTASGYERALHEHRYVHAVSLLLQCYFRDELSA